jgi:hypothetical protein
MLRKRQDAVCLSLEQLYFLLDSPPVSVPLVRLLAQKGRNIELIVVLEAVLPEASGAPSLLVSPLERGDIEATLVDNQTQAPDRL